MKNLDIENILYDGSKEEIEEILKEYEISFSYISNNFNFESKKLLQISKGYNSAQKPNCVTYFGENFNI